MVVLECFVPMPVRMRPTELTRGMRVAMMLVMHVSVKMLDRLVRVAMTVRFAEEAPDTDGHERSGDPEPWGNRLGKHTNRRYRSDERRGGEIGACA